MGARFAIDELERGRLLLGDAATRLKELPAESVSLVISSPPYNIGKSYEKGDTKTIANYLQWQAEVIDELDRVLSPDGSICWQVGNYVKGREYIPLDVLFYDLFIKRGYKLRNRIIWRFNFGLNADRRFSGRYETLLWFTKSDQYRFNLDPVRIPQLYPGKRHSKDRGLRAGKPSGNPAGKNPSDYWEFSAEQDFLVNPVWDIPNVKARHPEKTTHPCQFPVELAERCVLALSQENEMILDPFVGTGAAVIAALKHNRRAIGIDKDQTYLEIARDRLTLLAAGQLPMRPLGKPVQRPNAAEKVAQIPQEWLLSESGK